LKHFVRLGFKAVGMKPIASGCEVSSIFDSTLSNADIFSLSSASNVEAPLNLISPYRFVPAIAPHIAAEQIGVDMDVAVISQAYQQLTKLAEVVIVEGVGGLFVPINQKQTLADVAQALNLPVILVVGMRLGCINHALLTVAALEQHGLKLAGWIANQIDPQLLNFDENLYSLRQRIDAPCMGVVAWQGELRL
jgi:dethiobiotin synthetase